jgi:CubicO group peptidase (beta-lactamase class C family)
MKSVLLLLHFAPFILFTGKNGDHETVTSNRFSTIQDSIVSKINKGLIPSFSVAVSEKGKVIWQQSFGWADKEKKIKATPSTSYALASLSKSITSTALMKLVEQGLVKFTDRVDKYLGDSKLTFFKGDSSKLTIDKLTNMVGGIPHEWQYLYADEKKKAPTIEEEIKHFGIVVFPPGEVFNYSNLSPGIVEQILRQVTKKSLQAFMMEQIFEPLAMKNAAVDRSQLSAKSMATGYDNNGKRLAESEFYPKGGAGYYASASDLLRYGMFHLKDKVPGVTAILKDETIDVLHHAVPYTPQNKFYANGWGVLNLPDQNTSLLSNGAIDGAASSLLLMPDRDIAIVCVTNATVGNDFTDQLAYQIANVLSPRYLDDLGKFMDANAPAFADKPYQPVDSLIGKWEGMIKTYRDSIPVSMFFGNDGKILVRLQGQAEAVLNNVTINNGILQGDCNGSLRFPEAKDIPHYLQLVVKIVNNEMYGSISAQSFQTTRPRFLIPAYISSKKVD